MYQTPLISWLRGLEGRVKAHSKWANPALLNIVRQDFSWFALQFLRDERVDDKARAAFNDWFLSTITPNAESFPPPPQVPAKAYEEVLSLSDGLEEVEDDEEAKPKVKRKKRRP